MSNNMLISAIMPDGSRTIADPELPDDQWDEIARLVRQYRGTDQQVVSPICRHPIFPKTSSLGTRFFSHYRSTECDAGVSEDHVALQLIAQRIAQQYGWQAHIEYFGPDRQWIADVYATKGDRKLAVEVQWSQQSSAEYIRRTMRYADDGVEIVWLERVRKGSNPETTHRVHYDKRSHQPLHVRFWKDDYGQYVQQGNLMLIEVALEEIFAEDIKPVRNQLITNVWHEYCKECCAQATLWDVYQSYRCNATFRYGGGVVTPIPYSSQDLQLIKATIERAVEEAEWPQIAPVFVIDGEHHTYGCPHGCGSRVGNFTLEFVYETIHKVVADSFGSSWKSGVEAHPTGVILPIEDIDEASDQGALVNHWNNCRC